MALFESYERREKQILDVLAQYDIKSIEECREICQAKGFDPYKIVELSLYTHLRAHETVLDLVCRLLLEKKNTHIIYQDNQEIQVISHYY